MEQALSFVSSAGDASHVHVPAKDAGVPLRNGTKSVELVDPISPSKLTSTTSPELPSLLSLIIDGLPSWQQSKYVNEAEKLLHKYADRHPNVKSLFPYCRVGLSLGSYLHPGVINVERLVIIGLNYGILFLVDDLLFDTPKDNLQDEYGVSREICGSVPKTREFLIHLEAVFKQEKELSNSASLVETLIWELGRDTLALSNREWFDHYIACVVECWDASVDSEEDIGHGRNLYFHNVESYTDMRIGNAGGRFIQMLVEFANDSYIPNALRADPYLQNLTAVSSIHIGFANDLCSYHKESQLEQNPRNLVTVLMECEGKPFVPMVHAAVDLTNKYAQGIMDTRAEAWSPTLQNHLHDVLAVLAGNVYFSIKDYRYRHADSPFPELRDMTSSWKILPYALA